MRSQHNDDHDVGPNERNLDMILKERDDARAEVTRLQSQVYNLEQKNLYFKHQRDRNAADLKKIRSML